jgi:4-amino-4-deoxy-L-arabinose transferase-like glycosyltransferase
MLFLALSVPWHILVEMRQPGFLDFYFINEHFRRFLTTSHHRDQPFWFLPLILFIGTMPWTGLLPMAIKQAGQRWRNRDSSSEIDLFLLLWPLVVFVFFMASHSQLQGYLLPMVCPLAILIGRHISEPSNESSQFPGRLLFTLFMIAVPKLGKTRFLLVLRIAPA